MFFVCLKKFRVDQNKSARFWFCPSGKLQVRVKMSNIMINTTIVLIWIDQAIPLIISTLLVILWNWIHRNWFVFEMETTLFCCDHFFCKTTSSSFDYCSCEEFYVKRSHGQVLKANYKKTERRIDSREKKAKTFCVFINQDSFNALKKP